MLKEGILPDVLRWREKGTDLRRKARGSGGSKPAENRVELHIWSNECKILSTKKNDVFTHVTKSFRVWSQGSVMLFWEGRIQYLLPRSKEDWYQREARQGETEDDLAIANCVQN